MIWRALVILLLVGGASVALTFAFGQEVLLALGLLLTQAKIILKKLSLVELAPLITWLKVQSAGFARVELIKKWATSSLMPLLLGSTLRRKLTAWITTAKSATTQSYQQLVDWYGAQPFAIKVITALIVLFGLLGLSVSSIGLWLILFSVKLPFWLLAFAIALGRTLWNVLAKTAFKTVAFLQLGLVWSWLERRLPEQVLQRKRRFDLRVARTVIRRRKMTVQQLEAQRDSFSLRRALWAEGWRQLWRGPSDTE